MSSSSKESIKPLLSGDEAGDLGDLRAVLEAADLHEPSTGDLDKLHARLAAALPPGTLPPTPAPPAPPAPPAAPVAGGVASKAILAVAISSTVLGLAIASWPSSPSTTTTTAPVTEQSATPPASASAPVASSSPVAEPTLSASAEPPASHTARPPAPPEATLLARAHEELLHGSPSKALETTAEHARAYPHGALAQEREVIAIESLLALGRHDEAKRRAKAFHTSYPSSSHGERIDRLVGDEAPVK